jgi:hypothetical protein
VTVGLPVLDAMLGRHGEAFAQGGKLPLRLVLWGWAHGLDDRFEPAQVGHGDAWQLSPLLQSFGEVKSHLTIVTGTNNPRSGHPGMYSMFSGKVPTEVGYLRPRGPTMDQLAGAQPEFDAGSGLRTLEVGISKTPNTDTTYKSFSFSGESTIHLPATDPAAVFDRVFRGRVSAGAEPSAAAPAAPPRPGVDSPTPWVLDAVRGDIDGLMRRLGPPDRRRLDQHLQAVGDLEKRIRQAATAVSAPLAAASCGTPVRPSAGGYTNNESFEKTSQLMNDVVAMALACDRTRVVSYMLTGPANGHSFDTYGGKREHSISHGGGWLQAAAPTFPMKMRCMSDLLRKLKAVREGAGSMLDNVAFFGTSDCAEPRSHSGRNMPIVLAGGAGGRLKTNLHHRAAGDSALLVGATVAAAIGLKEKPFGASVMGPLLA